MLENTKITGITNNKDIDREILLFLLDKDLLVMCSLNKYFYYSVCDDNFFHRKLSHSYPDTLKHVNTNYKCHYLKVVYYVFKLQSEFNYFYRFGNIEKSYEIFLKVKNISDLLIQSAIEGEIELIFEAVRRGANISQDSELALRWACAKGYLLIVRYLTNNGANIHIINEQPLVLACSHGHLEIVRYLIFLGADIHNHRLLKMASAYGQLDVIKLLVKYGVYIDDEALQLAHQNGHLDVVNYLSSL